MAEENKNQEQKEPEKLKDLHIAAQNPLKLNVISMINPVLGWVVSHWKIALFLILILVIYVQHELINHYKAENSANVIEISTLKANVSTLTSTIADQNQKIQDAAKDNKNKQDQLDALDKKLKDKEIKDQQTIDALRKKPIGTTCQDALNFMDDYIKAGKWQN